jgi:hypothetical protein
MNPDRRKELKQQYKEIKVEAGVYQIRNTSNEKSFVASTRNLKTLNGKELQLKSGSFPNKRLQADWNLLGPEAFVIEVLEVLIKPQEEYIDEKEALKRLEEKWIQKLQPFGEHGYN